MACLLHVRLARLAGLARVGGRVEPLPRAARRDELAASRVARGGGHGLGAVVRIASVASLLAAAGRRGRARRYVLAAPVAGRVGSCGREAVVRVAGVAGLLAAAGRRGGARRDEQLAALGGARGGRRGFGAVVRVASVASLLTATEDRGACCARACVVPLCLHSAGAIVIRLVLVPLVDAFAHLEGRRGIPAVADSPVALVLAAEVVAPVGDHANATSSICPRRASSRRRIRARCPEEQPGRPQQRGPPRTSGKEVPPPLLFFGRVGTSWGSNETRQGLQGCCGTCCSFSQQQTDFLNSF